MVAVRGFNSTDVSKVTKASTFAPISVDASSCKSIFVLISVDASSCKSHLVLEFVTLQNTSRISVRASLRTIFAVILRIIGETVF